MSSRSVLFDDLFLRTCPLGLRAADVLLVEQLLATSPPPPPSPPPAAMAAAASSSSSSYIAAADGCAATPEVPRIATAQSDDLMDISRSGGDRRSTYGGGGGGGGDARRPPAYEPSPVAYEAARFSVGVGGNGNDADQSFDAMGSFDAGGESPGDFLRGDNYDGRDGGGGSDDGEPGSDAGDGQMIPGQVPQLQRLDQQQQQSQQQPQYRWRCVFCTHNHEYKTASAMIQHLVPGQPERIPCPGATLKAFLKAQAEAAVAAGKSERQAERGAKAAAAEACKTTALVVVAAPGELSRGEGATNAAGGPQTGIDCEWCRQQNFKDANTLRQHQGLATNWLLGYEPTACRSLPDGFHERNKGAFNGTPRNWWVMKEEKLS